MSAATHQLLLALDYGGTKHTAALLVPGERAWLAHGRVYAPPGADGAWDQAAMLRLARELLAQHPGRLARDRRQLRRAGGRGSRGGAAIASRARLGGDAAA